MAEGTEGKEIRLEQTHTALKPISTLQSPPPWAIDTAGCSSVGRQDRIFPCCPEHRKRHLPHVVYFPKQDSCEYLRHSHVSPRDAVSSLVSPRHWAHGIGSTVDLLYSFATVTDLDVPSLPRLLGDGVKFVCTNQARSLFSDSQAGGRGAGASSMCDRQHPCAANSLPRWEVLTLGSLLAKGTQSVSAGCL